ncbi:MAG: hypothetical protein UT30_C0021G0003 [Candidatus Uhrbacteria bacterium GW2011_GWF2_39_13]|uniref:Uncharacterized protein n=1 Tax=Candidatus Uhrbacteria bacterium GW2011_GWF2_39_13 TaxID=1618995 RepID=A0A0G0MI51_9BACT|nr:MAG: hypothetical protein UT30_C0021G0003 [Candidatus Uhrbacteria bacterium GW2011_GWF2_39_13]
MNPIFVIKLGNGIMKNYEHQNAVKNLLEHPMFKELEETISVMERYIAEAVLKHKLLLQLRSDILEAFGIKEKPETEQEAPKKKAEKPEAKSPLKKPSDPRLAILEKGTKKVIKIFKKSRMLKRSKLLKPSMKALIGALQKSKQCKSETERVVQLEAAIGEGLNCLQNSKMASRSKVLKEIKGILEETIDSKNQVGK